MISTFACKDTNKVFKGEYTKKWDGKIRRKGQMKLDILDSAMNLEDLKTPPGNRLHALKDDLNGFHSISINKQWRIIFIWKNDNAYEVSITDYH